MNKMIKYNSVNKIYELYRNTTSECGFENKSSIEFGECIIEYIHWLIKRYKMKYVVLEQDENMKPQITFIKHTGSNGKEGSESRIITNVRKDRMREVQSYEVSNISVGAICPEYDVNSPYLNIHHYHD